MDIRKVRLANKNNTLVQLFEYEVNVRLRAEYSLADETNIMQNMLTDSDPADKYSRRLREIRLEVKNEMETILGKPIDIKYDLTSDTEGVSKTISSLLGENKAQYAEQFRRALQLFVDSLDEDSAMEVATLYDEWEADKTYQEGKYLRRGVNGVGDPQLFRVGQTHTSLADQPPGTPHSTLYTAVGLDDNGYPVWSRPVGKHDAYDEGDIVSFKKTPYISKINSNCTVPNTDNSWEVVGK